MSSDGYARVHTDASSSGPRAGRLVAVAIGLGAIISVAMYLNTHHAYRCSDLDALGPHSCAIQSRRKAAEASLATALSACEWNVTAVSYRFAMEQKQFYDKTAEERATTRRLCVSGEWRVTELGPLVGRGGYDWHEADLDDVGALGSDPPGATPYMRAHRVAARGNDGAVFGLPPIHLHHVVLSPTGKDEFKFAASGAGVASSLTKPLTLSDPGLGRGGDMVCSDGDEGAACLLWSLPDGYGTPLPTGPDGFRGSALLNDVRGGPMKVMGEAASSAAAGSTAPLEFYLQFSMRVSAAEPKHVVRCVDIHNPYDLSTSKEHIAEQFYYLPRGRSVMAYAAPMPEEGTIVQIVFHSHKKGEEGVWVVSADAPDVWAALGAHAKSYSLPTPKPPKPWKPAPLHPADRWPVAAIDAALRTAGLRVRCAAERKAVDIVGGEEYDRRTPLVCPETWSWKAGDPIAIVGLEGTMVEDFSQHAQLYVYYATPNRESIWQPVTYGSQTKAANALRMQGVPISNVAKWKVRGGFPE